MNKRDVSPDKQLRTKIEGRLATISMRARTQKTVRTSKEPMRGTGRLYLSYIKAENGDAPRATRKERLQFVQVTRNEAVLVVQNAVLQRTKRPNPKECKLADVSKGSFLASSLGDALAEPKFRYATARYGAP